MTLSLPIHWRRRGEVVCGVTLTAAQHAKRSSADAQRVTCPNCVAVQFAMVGASDLRRDELARCVQDRIDSLPRSGWVASRIRAAFRRAVKR
ncbi:MAG: hypothetical protein JNL12_22215 [Planctomycetes bacterium]|nr:hypothetical protein [Planctomycetota bacterium]